MPLIETLIRVAVLCTSRIQSEPATMSSPTPDIDEIIQGAAAKYGVDPDTMRAFAGIESGGRPNTTIAREL